MPVCAATMPVSSWPAGTSRHESCVAAPRAAADRGDAAARCRCAPRRCLCRRGPRGRPGMSLALLCLVLLLIAATLLRDAGVRRDDACVVVARGDVPA